MAPSDPNVIYAGMGDTMIRIDVSHGDGVYKSTDGGKTWQHMGLADTRAIGKIRVHPSDPDLVYVATLRHAFGDNEELRASVRISAPLDKRYEPKHRMTNWRKISALLYYVTKIARRGRRRWLIVGTLFFVGMRFLYRFY